MAPLKLWLRFLPCFLALAMLGGVSRVTYAQQNVPPVFQEIAGLYRQGVDALAKQDYDRAEQSLSAAYRKAEGTGDKYSMGTMLDALGGVYMGRGDSARGLETKERAVRLLRESRNKKGLAQGLVNLGVAYGSAGKADKGVPLVQESIDLWEELQDRFAASGVRIRLANLYCSTGQFDKARQTADQSLQAREQLNAGPGALAESHNELGVIFRHLAQYEAARREFEAVMRLAQQANQERTYADALTNLGNTLTDQGQFADAMTIHQRALAILEKGDDPVGVTKSLLNIAGVCYKWGHYDWSLYHARRALALAEKTGSKDLIAGADVVLSASFNTLGQYRRAADALIQAVDIFGMVGDQAGLSKAAFNLGQLRLALGDPAGAVPLFERALGIARQGGDLAFVADAESALGAALDGAGRKEEALAMFQAAHQQYSQSGSASQLARSYANMGVIYSHLKRYDEAMHALEQSLALQRKTGNVHWIATALANLGGVAIEQERWEEAEPPLKEAIADAEMVRDEIAAPSDIGAFQTGNLGEAYARYANVLVHLNRAEEALVQAERGRGQGLARQAAQVRTEWGGTLPPGEARKLVTATEALRTAEANLRGAQSQAEKLSLFADEPSRDAATKSVDEARRVRDDAQLSVTTLRKDLAARYPEYRTLCGLDNPTAAMFTSLARQNPGTLYLTWSVAPEQTVLFAIRSGAAVKAFPVVCSRAELEQRVDAWREAITPGDTGGAGADPRREEEAAQSLYALLLGPAEKDGLLSLPEVKRLVVVGDGPLRELPFAALLDGKGKRLIERFPLATSISLRLLASSQTGADTSKPVGRGILCVADPGGGDSHKAESDMAEGFAPLPAARKEGQAIAGLFGDGATLLIGDAATEEAVRPLLVNSRLLHFATHGLLDDQEGLRSGLLLAPPPGKRDALDPVSIPLLTANQILERPLSAELAVLSACETGRGERSGGEGLLGLVWAFQAAGCPSVVASQWSVDDASTGQLMVRFYTGLRSGRRRDEALRDAMLSVRGAGKTSAPYYWAAFELHGESGPLRTTRSSPTH